MSNVALTALGWREPLWRKALLARATEFADHGSMGARARLVLANLLGRTGYRVSLTTVHAWPRHVQGEAYLWAVAFLAGREDIPAPEAVHEAAAAEARTRGRR